MGEAADGQQALEAAAATAPDVVLMDCRCRSRGVAATRLLLAERPGTRVVALTSFSDRRRVTDILAAGATGYVLKDCRPDDLLAAVRAAADGHVPLDPRVAAALLPSREPPLADQLSEREKQVLRLVAAAWRTSRSPVVSASPSPPSKSTPATSSAASASPTVRPPPCGRKSTCDQSGRRPAWRDRPDRPQASRRPG